MAKQEREPIDWITVNGTHVPIYEGETWDVAVNRFWAEHDAKRKEQQIEANKKEADEKNGKKETYIERNEDGEIIFKAMITDDKGNRRAFQFSASSKEQARQDLKGNGYRVTPRTLLPKKLFDHVINHTNASDWDWDEAQELFKKELKGK